MGYGGSQLSQSRYTSNVCQVCLRFLEVLFSLLAFADVHDCSDVFGKFAGFIENRVCKAVDIPNRSILMNDSTLQFKITSLSNSLLKALRYEGSILGMYKFHLGISRLLFVRIQTTDAKLLSRPVEFSGGCVPTPTASVTQSLSFS